MSYQKIKSPLIKELIPYNHLQVDYKYNYNTVCPIYYYNNNLFTGTTYSGAALIHIKNGFRHCEDGPAIKYFKGCGHAYFYNGKEIVCKNNEEYLKIIKLLVFK